MKISNTTAYPNESPVSLSDYLIGTETTTGDLETKTFTISGMFGLILDGTSYNLPLFYADSSGVTATKIVNSIISQSSDTATLATVNGSLSITSDTITNNLELEGTVTDFGGSTGTAGQLLSSTGTGYTSWVDPIASGLNFVGAWDASVGGGGSPDLTNPATQTPGNYYIVSDGGTAYPNGSPNPPSSWAAGDWVIFADAPANEWQKIDNTSGAIAGSGTVNTIPLWTPTGVQLGDSNIKQDGATGDISVDFTGVKAFKVIEQYKAVQIGEISTLTTTGTGNFSLSVGTDHTISGANSVAMGSTNTVSGNTSVVIGAGSEASGSTSIALGQSNTSSGSNSVTIGNRATASGKNSLAIGLNVDVASNTTSSGEGSIAVGEDVISSGNNSFATGYDNTASGNTSFVAGSLNTASGVSSFTAGQRNTAAAFSSTATGLNNTVASTAIGSFAAGQGNTVYSDNAAAFGSTNTIGDTSGVNGAQSLVLGEAIITYGENSFSAGFNIQNYGAATSIFGQYNEAETTAERDINDVGKIDTADQGLFIIGNGDSTTSSNAFKVNWDGRATIYGSLELESTLTDGTGGVGSAGQLLSSTGTGVEWVDGASGAIGGSGTVNTLPIFSPDGTTIADSAITQDDTASPGEVNISTVGKFDITNKSITGGDNATNSVTGTNSVGIGENITVGGDEAAAFNGGTIASKDYSTALNFYSAAYGFDALAAGHESFSLGHASTALGYESIAGLIADGTMSSSPIASTSAVINISAEEETILDNAKDSAQVDGTSGTITAGDPIQINPLTTGNLVAGFFVYGAGILDETEVVSYDGGLSRITLNKDVTVANLQLLNFFKPYQMVVANTLAAPIDIETTDPAPYITDWDSGTNTVTLSSAQTLNTSSDIYIFDSDESYGSTAVGYQTRSFASGAFAAGTSTKARGDNSTALNNNTEASGADSFAAITSSTASGTRSIAMGNGATASGQDSIAMGNGATASAQDSIALGATSSASNSFSVAIGDETTASGSNSTSMGYATTASGDYSTAMGDASIASGEASTAMGDTTQASGETSTATGNQTIASGISSFAGILSSVASGNRSIAMGSSATASGDDSIALGNSATASNVFSIAIGEQTDSSGNGSLALGYATLASGTSSTAMGDSTIASGQNSTAMGDSTEATEIASIAMGRFTTASGESSIAVGNNVEATGDESISVGKKTITGRGTASGVNSAAIGFNNLAQGDYSIALGQNDSSTGNNSFSMGQNSTASGAHSFAHGLNSTASGTRSFSNGWGTTASGTNAWVGGKDCVASGDRSFAFGLEVNADDANMVAFGKYNKLNTGNNSIFQVGVGASDAARDNAFDIHQNGIILMSVLQQSTSYANDAAAQAGGVPIGGLYRNGSVVQIRIV